MKTTLYGNGETHNEFGHPKEPKETNFVHAIYKIKDALPMGTIKQLCAEFHAKHGCYPTRLLIPGGSNGSRYLGFELEEGMVGLNIEYNAAEAAVA